MIERIRPAYLKTSQHRAAERRKTGGIVGASRPGAAEEADKRITVSSALKFSAGLNLVF